MTQPGETDHFTAEDHLRTLFDYSPELELDYVLINSATIGGHLREKYLSDGAAPVDTASLLRPGFEDEPREASIQGADRLHRFQIIARDVLHEDGLVRHDPAKLARLLLEIHQNEMIATR